MVLTFGDLRSRLDDFEVSDDTALTIEIDGTPTAPRAIQRLVVRESPEDDELIIVIRTVPDPADRLVG
jgi:hypothetical protein